MWFVDNIVRKIEMIAVLACQTTSRTCEGCGFWYALLMDDLRDFMAGKGYEAVPAEFRHYGCDGTIRLRKCDKCGKTGRPILMEEFLKPKAMPDGDIDWGEFVARFEDEPIQ